MPLAPPPGRSSCPRLAFAAALVLVGCGPAGRVADCRRVVAVVNPALDRIEAQARAPEGSAEKYAQIAVSYLALDRELGALPPPRDPEIASLVVQYRQHLERAGQLTQQLAVAPAGQPPGRNLALERELGRLTERHRGTSRQLDLACLGHR